MLKRLNNIPTSAKHSRQPIIENVHLTLRLGVLTSLIWPLVLIHCLS